MASGCRTTPSRPHSASATAQLPEPAGIPSVGFLSSNFEKEIKHARTSLSTKAMGPHSNVAVDVWPISVAVQLLSASMANVLSSMIPRYIVGS